MRNPEDAWADALPLELQRVVMEEARLRAKLREVRQRRDKLERLHQALLQVEPGAEASLRVA